MTTVRSVEFRPAVNDDLVYLLQGWLDRAKAGDLESGAFCGVLRDGGLFSGVSRSANGPLLLSAAVRLVHRINLSMDDTAVPA